MLGHLGRCLSKCFGRWNSQPQRWSWVPKTIKNPSQDFPCLKMAFQLIQTLAISPGWLLKWLCCFPRTAMRERWSDFVRRRNDAAPASVSWAAQGLECENWDWPRTLRKFVGEFVNCDPKTPTIFCGAVLEMMRFFMLCLGVWHWNDKKTLRLVWCWWSPVHGCRWRWKARCKNHLAGKKTTWDGGFCTNFTSFFQFFPYQIFRSIVMINGPCSVAMMEP